MRNLSPVRFISTKQILSSTALAVKYHQHTVVGDENFPADGGWLMITNHSLATYDNSLISYYVWKKQGRIVRSLGDRAIFKTPIYRDFATAVGCVEGNNKAADELAEQGEIILISPGGMAESVRSSKQKRQLMWDTRKGFIRLSVRKQVPVVLTACPAGDDIFDVGESRLTDVIYQKFRMPFVPVRGRFGLPVPIPKPIKLTHYVSPPFVPPVVDVNDKVAFDAAVDEMHAKVKNHMQRMLDEPGWGTSVDD